ncbi:MAG: DMT family transporter [Rhodospirillales bacterium]|jgi:drug/metabolite transporter (DMT)-like permease|nr:DMT family transporter [Rhodospirillales bacterium]MBT4040180.1 DMT family transporter [Rhodospirillales bacterium]MBT4628548.1 DMT family transporter [Rhodospirillales bacterium]MBT5352676.1 DMT family transporter [Rhodospirillales bacterium]MBT5521688.1 DMT family transporter [Rhodospirillales bacterium]
MSEPITKAGVSRRGFAMGIMVLGSVVISFAGVLVRNIEDADPWQINFYRAAALVAATLLILLIQYRGETITRIRRVGWPGIWGGMLLSVAGIAYLQSITNTTVANTLFMLSAIPFFTALLAWLIMKERLQRETLITMLVAAAGVSVMLTDGFGVGSMYGNLMGVVTALGFSGFAVIVRKYRDVDMMPTLVISSAIILVVSFLARYDDLDIPVNDIVLCFIWGAILSGLANWIFIVASRYLIAAEVTLFMMLEFSLGPIWVWLFVAEVPSHLTIVGGAMVISAVACRSVAQLVVARKHRVPVDPAPPL